MVQWYEASDLQRHHDHAFQTRDGGTSTLPPGHDDNSFRRVLGEFQRIIGQENVFVGPELTNFRDPYPLLQESFEPSAGLWSEPSLRASH